MVVVNDLDERLHLAALVLPGFRHAACDLERVAFDAGDECVWEGMCFAAVVLRLENDDFLACVAAAGDDGLCIVRIADDGRFVGVLRTTRPTLRTAELLAVSHCRKSFLKIDIHFMIARSSSVVLKSFGVLEISS